MTDPAASSDRTEHEEQLHDRRRRLRRLVDSIEQLESDASYPIPPARGVVMAGAEFRAIGREFLEYLVTFGGLPPDADVLDVGCGGGRIAAPLTYYLDQGSYVGFDVHDESIQWCKEKLEPNHPRFHFEHVDLFNDRYNRTSTNDATSFRFPYDDRRFDFILAVSLFTHMFRDEVANYLSEFARVLRPGGAAFVTGYLLNPDSVNAMAREPRAVKFPHAHRDALVQDPDRPATAVALHQEWLVADARRVGLGVDRIAHGAWTTQARLSWQDIMLLRRDR